MKAETLFSFSGRMDEWETPDEFFQDLDKEFHVDIDACASDKNHKCDMYFTIDDDGLSENWVGHTVWCNPPYKDIKRWIRKCYYEGHKPNTVVVCLVPARTDTKWWWNYVHHRAEVRFIRGRIRFIGPDAIANAPFPSALVIYRGPEEMTTKEYKQITWNEINL